MEYLVTIEEGQIKGQQKLNYEGKPFYSFQGIPFAKPPLGELRFKAPQPVDPWPGTFDATKEGDQCFSFGVMGELVGSEDCLNLNVFTPTLPSDDKINIAKPVLFYIHGGGFVSGSGKSDMYGPEFLLTQDIVFVTFNYRLGVLGFLSLEDTSLGVPGNAGLKDMVLALKWVQRNIAKFSGDPNNVTIGGVSAGSASVHYLMLSPMAKGLFHKAIAQSGCALNYWAQGKRVAKDLAEELHLETQDEKEILERLRETPLPDLLTAQLNLKKRYDTRLGEIGIHGPVVETPSEEEPPFISEDPLEIIRKGRFHDVPLVIGYTSHEGMLLDVMKTFAKSPPSFITDFEDHVPPQLGLKRGSKESKEVSEKIKRFFFGDETPSGENKQFEYILETDCLMLREIHQVVKEHIKVCKSPVYFYKFCYETGLNVVKKIANIKHKGAGHGDDIGYFFKTMFTPDITSGSPEDFAIKRMTKLWATFAANGDPNPQERTPLIDVEWKPVTKDAFNYYNIDEELSMGVDPEADRIAFWEGILKGHV